MIRLFEENFDDFRNRLSSFIGKKYDLMLAKLQFDNDLLSNNFRNPGEIVDFVCDKLAQGGDGARILVPQQIRRDLRADLTVRTDQEFDELLDNNGLINIFHVVRTELASGMKSEFLENHIETLYQFFDEDIIDDRILNQIWNHLQSMRCPHLCPWCGMPCCGITECNDKYKQGEIPCEEEARNMHSCQFHRDDTITGVSRENQTDTLPNLGDCPNLIKRNQKRNDWDPDAKKFVQVPYTYYETTWRIRSADNDKENNYGLFWKWFHAHVSFFTDSVNDTFITILSFKRRF